MTARHVIVVGAGIGGLVAALELASHGVRVTVLERADAPGGKMREVCVGGQEMDAGPTVFTMRWVFDELFASLGENLDRHLTLKTTPILARHAWNDGSTLDLFADVQRAADAIGQFAGADQARGYLAFCSRAQGIYQALEEPFLRRSRPTPLSLLARAGWRAWPRMARISPFTTMWAELGRHFTDPRLRQLFGRYATYCGSSPFRAPATLMLVAHVEQEGVWLVQGGMHRVAQCLADLASRRGVHFRYGAHVEQLCVQGRRVTGVQLVPAGRQRTGQRDTVSADAVVFNGDPAALHAGRLGPEAAAAVGRPRARSRRSLSALTWNLLAHAEGFEMQRHNVFFSNNSAREFDDLFKRARLPSEPTVYVCAQDRDGSPPAEPGGAQRLLVLVNAPASGDQTTPTPEEIAECETRTFRRLAQCGLRLSQPAAQRVLTTPANFEAMFPSTGGALYGQATHGWAASFTRPGTHTRLQGLYLAGGSTHPGPGVPMAALSGRLAAASLLADLPSASTAPFRRAATPGGTSTR